ncbi:MAG: FeoA domain-containing protein [Pirellulales bacterium]|nr:FeoA domain-containing protein [Pirellulales bacterium]
MYDLVPISRLQRGTRAMVADVVGTLEQVQRMREMGVSQGVELEMVQPGSPCIVRFGGHRLCIRSDDMLGVLVRPGVPS